MIVGCITNKTHGFCGFLLVTAVPNPLWVSMIYHEEDAGKLKRALKRAPEQLDVWKTSLTE